MDVTDKANRYGSVETLGHAACPVKYGDPCLRYKPINPQKRFQPIRE
jgi:hypothetical protein